MRFRVLIVDDDTGTLSILRAYIERIDQNALITAACSAEEAFRLINEAAWDGKPFNLVVLDHWLPGSNGLILWNTLAKRYPEIDYLFISGMDYEEWFKVTSTFGEAPPFIRKPLNELQLRRFWQDRYSIVGHMAG